MNFIEHTKRCTRCILPEQYPDIKFDEKGVCHKCHEADAKYLKRDLVKKEKELQGIFNWAKAQNKRYDCIVPFSGGKDSSYTIYVCGKKYGLKVLAVNFINGLQTFEAVRNMKKISEKLDAAFASYGPSIETLRKLYRAFFLKTGQFCFPCDMGIWATVQRFAEQYDVPLIVSGFSAQIESRGPKIYSYNNRLFRTVAQGVISEREMKDFLEESTMEKILRRLKHFRLTRYRRQISLPEYMVWDDVEIKKTIVDEFGWEKRADGSSDHIDCLFAPMKNYLVVQKWGFGEKTTKYASMTRADQLDRNEALRKAKEDESVDPVETKKTFCSFLGITEHELKEAKEKTHLKFL